MFRYYLYGWAYAATEIPDNVWVMTFCNLFYQVLN